MKHHHGIHIIGLIILLACIAGCTSTSPSTSQITQTPSVQPVTSAPPATSTPTTEIKLSTIEPSEMALQLSDLPDNYSIKDRSELVGSDVIKEAVDLGWKKGYTVNFVRGNFTRLEGTSIEQGISVYPIENMYKVLSLQRNLAAKYYANGTADDSVIIDDFSNPGIGDQSQAYRITLKSDNSKSYIIDFIKKDVFESLRMSGSITDYETLKDLAKTAAAKIK
ncbi:MAG: hypothetical protein M0Q91_13095 [Methanoregula sp.]|jgi:hypothetical protein|nr:hypothetical protein [Methanoregula sp.]